MKFFSLDNIPFDNSYARLPEHFYHRVKPTPLAGARLVSCNHQLASQIGLDPCSLQPELLAQMMTGNIEFSAASPLAMKYAGHQFGQYNPDLGDGRGILIGETQVYDDSGLEKRFDWHLKGAGKTHFSRMGDGRAVLRSSIREYLISEAMAGLNIPTTRALALCVSSDFAQREKLEPCATLLRISECHIRFGHFEHFYYQKDYSGLTQLADYCIDRYFPELKQLDSAAEKYWQFYQAIFHKNTALVAQWQAYGFVHGVLNTDNISILGETFDYGPFEFMDLWQNNRVANHSDYQGRYAFNNQPAIMQWNLSCLAQALTPLILGRKDKEANVSTVNIEDINALLSSFPEHFQQAWLAQMSLRLGLQTAPESLCKELLALLERLEIDGCRFFYKLSHLEHTNNVSELDLPSHWKLDAEFSAWFEDYLGCIKAEGKSQQQRLQSMQEVNPKYLLRNYMLQETIEKAEAGDFQQVNDLLRLVRNPFAHSSLANDSHFIRFAASPPEWARGIELSCSS
jgi:uncharacterized protein YdiU (UPF0061 family)